MNHATLGSMIASLRYEKGYSKRKLCRGICTTTMLDRIESEIVDPDIFLLDMLLQRLGRSGSRMEAFLSDEEYICIRERDHIEQYIRKNEKNMAIEYLNEYEKKYALDNRIHKMYVLRSRACICYRIDQNTKQAERYIRQAIEVTMPGMCLHKLKDDDCKLYLFAGNEIENLLALGLYLIKLGKDEEAKEWITICHNYVEHMVTEGKDYAILNSKITWLLAQLWIKEKKYIRSYKLCEEALNHLRKHGILCFMIPLLEQMIICEEKVGMNIRMKKWNTCYKVLLELYRDYGEAGYCQDSLFNTCYLNAYYLTSEIIRQERSFCGYTQADLIEGIYEFPGNLSRLERGETAPSKRTFEGLMKKFGWNRGKYHEEWMTQIQEVPTEAQNPEGEFDIYQIHRVPFVKEVQMIHTMCRKLIASGHQSEAVAIYDNIIRVIESSKMDAKYQSRILSPILEWIVSLDPDEKRCRKGIAYELSCGMGNRLSALIIAQSKQTEDEIERNKLERMADIMGQLFYYNGFF